MKPTRVHIQFQGFIEEFFVGGEEMPTFQDYSWSDMFCH